MARPVTPAEKRLNTAIQKLATQGMSVAEIAQALKDKRMKATDSRIRYHFEKVRDSGSSEEKAPKNVAKAGKPVKTMNEFGRALKVLETDVLTADEKVTIATHILKAKPTA